MLFRNQLHPVTSIEDMEKFIGQISNIVDARADKGKNLRVKVKLSPGKYKWVEFEKTYLEEA